MDPNAQAPGINAPSQGTPPVPSQTGINTPTPAQGTAPQVTTSSNPAPASGTGGTTQAPNPSPNPVTLGTTGGPTASTAGQSLFIPPKPIMGGIEQVGPTEIIAWTGGGPPNATWTGLDPTAPTHPVTPNQYRSRYVSTSQKGHNYRQTGISTKFSRSSDLTAFEHAVWYHLIDAGMDPVAYVPDPVDPTKMVNCVKEHGRFTVESISKQIKLQLSKYDTYDQQNDREARQFLLDSLDSDLAREVRDVSEPGEAFPITFLRLIKIIRSTSCTTLNVDAVK